MTTIEKLADTVKQARKAARLSQDELADLSAISRRPVYLLESGRGAVRIDSLIRMLDALGLELEIRPKRAKDD